MSKQCVDFAAWRRRPFRAGDWRSSHLREFVEAGFADANLDWQQYVKHDPRHAYRITNGAGFVSAIE
jgi:hypothetical protein